MEGVYLGAHSTFQTKELMLVTKAQLVRELWVWGIRATYRFPMFPNPLTSPILAARLLGGLGILLLTHTSVIEKPTLPTARKKSETYLPPIDMVDCAIIYPRIFIHHHVVTCQNLSPVLSNQESQMARSFLFTYAIPACRALTTQIAAATIQGGLIYRQWSVFVRS